MVVKEARIGSKKVVINPNLHLSQLKHHQWIQTLAQQTIKKRKRSQRVPYKERKDRTAKAISRPSPTGRKIQFNCQGNEKKSRKRSLYSISLYFRSWNCLSCQK